MADSKAKGIARKIVLTGIVQGVGFRPFVYRTAGRHDISGYVKNVSGCVEILACGKPSAVESFIHDIIESPPKHAKIENAVITDSDDFSADGFTISESGENELNRRFFSPDLTLCDDCRDETFNANDRRHRHFFNNCVSCGPRYSILSAFPYDRENTSMSKFKMCPQCGAEYQNPSNRRFHAEAIACNNCGPTLFYKHKGGVLSGEKAFKKAVEDLQRGEIAAIKGIGGYHFACLPSSSVAVKRLRAQKGRDDKPFAIMFRDIAEIQRVCEVTDADIRLLKSSARPIVLLPIMNNPFAPEVLLDNARCGCFLPYTPLHEMLMQKIPCLVMTSANVSSSPIIFKDSEMLSSCANVLYNNRDIMRSVDDSVVQTVYGGKTQIIRRARGYVPLPIETENPSGKSILAMGGDLKAAFSLSDGNYYTLSPYIGDLENVQVVNRYRESISDFTALFGVKPDLIARDGHPRYFSSRIAEQLAKDFNIPLMTVSHHHAHIASVMAEKKLEGSVIGVAFDGGGYGDDGNIWGGEFLICENGECRRAAHLEYTALLGADSASKDAQATAACFLHKNRLPFEHPSKDILSAALSHGVNTFLSSSVGRLFDAVASIMGICRENSYEGQCATALQYHAEKALRSNEPHIGISFSVYEKDNTAIIGHNDIIEKAGWYAKNAPSSSGAFALGFHHALADMVLNVCKKIRDKENITQAALSGGVFQNSLLLSLCVDRLTTSGFSVYFNSEVPPNDGGLALGQSYIAARRL